MSRTARSILALLALVLFLATGTAHALPSNGPSPERVSGTVAAVWDWLVSALGLEDVIAPMFDAATGSGTSQNPNLLNVPQTDVGGFIDPNGQH